jgi:hypothetical protein
VQVCHVVGFAKLGIEPGTALPLPSVWAAIEDLSYSLISYVFSIGANALGRGRSEELHRPLRRFALQQLDKTYVRSPFQPWMRATDWIHYDPILLRCGGVLSNVVGLALFVSQHGRIYNGIRGLGGPRANAPEPSTS